jgi:hypothetical protein
MDNRPDTRYGWSGTFKVRRLTAFHLKAVALVSALALVAAAVGSSEASGAASTPSPAAEAESYIAAIGPAKAELTKVDAELKALPITATRTQVNQIVAPLPASLKPLNAVIGSNGTSSVAPTSSSRFTTAQALGAPAISLDPPHTLCGGTYGAAGPGSTRITIANQRYEYGFQLEAGCSGYYYFPNDTVVYTWQISGQFSSFTAEVGLDSSNSEPGGIEFLNSAGNPMPFTAAGKTVTELILSPGLPISIDVNLLNASSLTIRAGCTEGAKDTTDFVSDHLVYK